MARRRKTTTGTTMTGGLSTLLTAPPPGTYDPSLDAEEAAAQRGLTDLESDSALGSTRALTDYGIGQQQYEQGRQRSLSDLLTRRGQTEEDYQRSTQGLARQYQRLGASQAERQAQMGVGLGGAVQQAVQKRAANQAYDQQGIDTGHTRALQSLDTAQQRTGEDVDQGLAGLALRFGRGEEDRGNTLARARREGQLFSQDVAGQRYWQALQSGTWPALSTQGIATPTPKKKKVR